jgi:hypothetical protein
MIILRYVPCSQFLLIIKVSMFKNEFLFVWKFDPIQVYPYNNAVTNSSLTSFFFSGGTQCIGCIINKEAVEPNQHGVHHSTLLP